MSRKREDVLVKVYAKGKYRICYTHTPGKWFVVKAENPQQARVAARLQEKWLVGTRIEDHTMGAFAKNFFNEGGIFAQYIQQRGLKHYAGYLADFRGRMPYILQQFGNVPLSAITSVEIFDWLKDLKSQTTGQPLSAGSKNKVLSTLRTLFDYAIFQGKLDVNPAKAVQPFHGAQRRPIFLKWELEKLFPQDDDKLLEIWGGLQSACFFLVLRDAGLRTGEALALAWENYSPELQCFAIVQKYEACTGNIVPGTKTGKPRAVAITKRTAMLLARLHKQQQRGGLIFSPYGNWVPKRAHFVQKTFKQALARAGVQAEMDGAARVPYSFRHTFVTNMLGTEIDAREVALLAGHSTDMQAVYNHPANQHLFKRIEHLRNKIDSMYS